MDAYGDNTKETQVTTPLIRDESNLDPPRLNDNSNNAHQPFLLQISINSVEELVKHAKNYDLKPVDICHNEKDCGIGIFHFGPNQHHHFDEPSLQQLVKNCPEEILLLTSHQKNISVFECGSKNYMYELDIMKKEMSCSKQQGRRLFVGTFVDTVFMFTYDVKQRKLVLNSQMCTHDSIVSIGLGIEGLIVCGQANGYVDLLTWQASKKVNGEYKMDNVSSI